MGLFENWKTIKQESSVDIVNMTIAEIIRNYQAERININPEYQRSYKWKNKNKTRFIESLFLGLPIPPIFAIKLEDDDGLYKYEIIDGVQRISTILEFVGVLRDDSKNKNENLNKLEGADLIPALNEITWENIKKTNMGFAFESSTLLFINLKTVNTKIKYETFKRLNTGGLELSPQEIRSNVLAIKGREEYVKFLNLYNEEINSSFLAKRDLKNRKDMELFIEFSLVKNYSSFFREKSSNLDFNEILNIYTEEVKLDTLINNIPLYKDFLNISKFFNFRKFNEKKNIFDGNFINLYFEISAFLYHKNKELINEKEVKDIFSTSYEEFCSKMGKKNPPAIKRLKMANDFVEEKYGNKI